MRTVLLTANLQATDLYSLRRANAAPFWFYKKGCQGKKFPRELEAAKSFGIQPPLPLCRCLEA